MYDEYTHVTCSGPLLHSGVLVVLHQAHSPFLVSFCTFTCLCFYSNICIHLNSCPAYIFSSVTVYTSCTKSETQAAAWCSAHQLTIGTMHVGHESRKRPKYDTKWVIDSAQPLKVSVWLLVHDNFTSRVPANCKFYIEYVPL